MSKTPTSVDMSLRRAKSRLKMGDTQEAEIIFQDILKTYPGNKRALKGLNTLRARTLKPEHAKNSGTALRDLSAHSILANGSSLFNAKQYNEAIHCFQKAHLTEPDFVPAYYNLSIAQKITGSYFTAIKNLKKLLYIDPTVLEAQKNLADCLQITGQHEDATKRYSSILKLLPDSAGMYCNHGVALKSINRYSEAANEFHKAVILDPEIAEAYNNLANIFDSFGHLAAALKTYQHALWLKPNSGDLHRNFCKLKKYAPDDPAIKHMERLKNDSGLSETEKMNFCFALGKAYGDSNLTDRSFESYREGNRLRKKLTGYDIGSDIRLFKLIKELFSEVPVLKNDVLPTSQSTICPIFIVGMPRSGTSLIEHILAGHSKVHGAGELPTLTELVAPIIRSTNINGPKPITPLSTKEIREQYLKKLSELDTEKPVIVDKMPGNFRWIGFIKAALPEAKIIHLKRDATAICWSNFKHYFSDAGNGFAYDLDDLGHYFNLYTDLMKFWSAQYGKHIYDVNYEAFTEDPQFNIQKLLAYCELHSESDVFNLQATNRAVQTASSMQVRQKIYTGSSEAWREYEEKLQPLKEALDKYQLI